MFTFFWSVFDMSKVLHLEVDGRQATVNTNLSDHSVQAVRLERFWKKMKLY